MPRLPLATDLKTRTGAPDKDARIKNAYVETRGGQSVVRKRPIAQGGISVATVGSIAQGGIGFTTYSGGSSSSGLFFLAGDTQSTYTGDGTTWNVGTNYVTGDHVTKNWKDYWAIDNNIANDPSVSPTHWSPTYVPAVPAVPPYEPTSWTLRTISAGYWTKIAWNGVVYCAIDGTSNNIAYSTNGISWTVVAIPAITANDICWDGNRFCVIGNDYSAFITSTNAVTWISPNLGDLIYSGTVVGNASVIVNISNAGGGGIAQASTNAGVSFNPVTFPGGFPLSVKYVAASWNGVIFCAITNLNKTATSTDGINWTSHTMAVSGSWVDIAWNGTIFCAIASNGATATSPDGIVWTSTGSLPAASTWRAIASNGSAFMAITFGNTKSATSIDGAVWQSVTLPVSSNWSDIESNGHDYCAISTTNSTNAATTP